MEGEKDRVKERETDRKGHKGRACVGGEGEERKTKRERGGGGGRGDERQRERGHGDGGAPSFPHTSTPSPTLLRPRRRHKQAGRQADRPRIGFPADPFIRGTVIHARPRPTHATWPSAWADGAAAAEPPPASCPFSVGEGRLAGYAAPPLGADLWLRACVRACV